LDNREKQDGSGITVFSAIGGEQNEYDIVLRSGIDKVAAEARRHSGARDMAAP
jgi:hypothetical protein